LTSFFDVIAQMWLAFFLRSLQMVLDLLNNTGHVVLEHRMMWLELFFGPLQNNSPFSYLICKLSIILYTYVLLCGY